MSVDVLAKVLETATERLVQEAVYEPALRYALVTRAVGNGVRVGNWLISNTGDGFCVTGTDSVAASGIHLYEVALHVAQRLVDGAHAQQAEVRRVLDLDRDYSLAVADASWLRERIRLAPAERAAILEDRYDHAIQRMFAAREAIRRLVG